MNIEQIADVCADNGRRTIAVSSGNSVLLAALDLEGRLFFSHNGTTASLFRKEAAENTSSLKNGYFNPGGDTLWPAPEGTCFGYCYASGVWMVPSALTSARYDVIAQSANAFEIAADIQLINNRQLGIPCRFIRKAQIDQLPDGSTRIEQFDAIEYTGTKVLSREDFMLAPWSLSQFSVTPDARASFGNPGVPVRDLYMPSGNLCTKEGETVFMRPDPGRRIQIALPEKSSFVRLFLPDKKMEITRTSAPLAPGIESADIADAPTDALPEKDVRYSIYNDPSGFMELEVAGGCKYSLEPGTVLGMNIINTIKTQEN